MRHVIFLTALDVSGTGFSDIGAAAICKLLKRNCALLSVSALSNSPASNAMLSKQLTVHTFIACNSPANVDRQRIATEVATSAFASRGCESVRLRHIRADPTQARFRRVVLPGWPQQAATNDSCGWFITR